jgi:hypothetical protein
MNKQQHNNKPNHQQPKHQPKQAFGAPKTKNIEVVDPFEEFAEPKKAPEQPEQPKQQEQQKAPAEAGKTPSEAPESQEVNKAETPKEAPTRLEVAMKEGQIGVHIPELEQAKPKSSKKGRSGRKARQTDELETEAGMALKKHLLHEKEVLELTYKSMNKKVLLNLMAQQILTNHGIYEDTAPVILNYLWENSLEVKGTRAYLGTLQHTATELGASYSNVQKVIKKLISVGLLEKVSKFLVFGELLVSFYSSLTDNMQIVLTFEHTQEEQMEAIDKDGHINESMAN